MKKEFLQKLIKKTLPYVLVAVLASAATWFAADLLPNSKLERLESAITHKFIGEADSQKIQDAAAEAMIDALEDEWSYYISAQEYAAHRLRQSNEMIGIGVTIQAEQEQTGFLIVEVVAGGPAEEAGIQAGDVITHADGTPLEGLTVSQVSQYIQGEKNTQVTLTLVRNGAVLEIPVTRKPIHKKVAEGSMLDPVTGYVRILNFHQDASRETIAEIEKLLEQGAEKLIFDVRDNLGGYVYEMVRLLDYLLPEGTLLRSVDYRGVEDVETSDEACLEMPMAVLINGNTYSAAELFAAALSEYDWAVTVGSPTGGKNRYQVTVELGDGSAVQLSTGAYTTAEGVDLAEAGGLKPDVEVLLTETAVSSGEDPQLEAAKAALRE